MKILKMKKKLSNELDETIQKKRKSRKKVIVRCAMLGGGMGQQGVLQTRKGACQT